MQRHVRFSDSPACARKQPITNHSYHCSCLREDITQLQQVYAQRYATCQACPPSMCLPCVFSAALKPNSGVSSRAAVFRKCAMHKSAHPQENQFNPIQTALKPFPSCSTTQQIKQLNWTNPTSKYESLASAIEMPKCTFHQTRHSLCCRRSAVPRWQVSLVSAEDSLAKWIYDSTNYQ